MELRLIQEVGRIGARSIFLLVTAIKKLAVPSTKHRIKFGSDMED
jgi:hypothetical protein